jgi:hypothetical protein
MSILKRMFINLILLAVLWFFLPGWSPLPCSTAAFSKAGNALILLIAANAVVSILQPILEGFTRPDPQGAPEDRNSLIHLVIKTIIRIRLFQDFSPGALAGFVLLALAAAGLQLGDYLYQRSQAVMPVVQAVTVQLPGGPPRQVRPGDQVAVSAGAQALFTAEMLQDQPVECLWSASRGVVRRGVGCSAVYIAPHEPGYDAISLTVQSTCKSMRIVQGIAVVIQ